MAEKRFPVAVTFWRVVFVFLLGAGFYAAYVRFHYGLGAATNLNDQFPWGLWIGFDVLCGVGLAAGGFTLAATVHIFNIRSYYPIVRPAILTAFLGYLLVIVALLFDLGLPHRIWHPLVMWNPSSVMFEVAWCVVLYTTVLALEFSPVLMARLGWERPIRVVHAALVPLVIAGVILSTLHQSSLGSLYLIVPHKLHPLWYSPMLPIFFFVSALAAGLGMPIFESWHSSKAFGRRLEVSLLRRLGRLLAVVLSVYLTMRFLDLWRRDSVIWAFRPSMETWLFWLEVLLLAVPAILLYFARVRASPKALYFCAVTSLLGFVANRLNVSITGMESASGVHYLPKWTEVALTLALVATGFAVFRLAVQYLPVFEEAIAQPASGGKDYRAVGQLIGD